MNTKLTATTKANRRDNAGVAAAIAEVDVEVETAENNQPDDVAAKRLAVDEFSVAMAVARILLRVDVVIESPHDVSWKQARIDAAAGRLAHVGRLSASGGAFIAHKPLDLSLPTVSRHAAGAAPQRLLRLEATLRRRTEFALRWFDRARKHSAVEDRFTTAWIALEAAAAIPSAGMMVGRKDDLIAATLASVYSTVPLPALQPVVKGLYAARRSIFHAAGEAGSTDPVVGFEALTKYADLLIEEFLPDLLASRLTEADALPKVGKRLIAALTESMQVNATPKEDATAQN